MSKDSETVMVIADEIKASRFGWCTHAYPSKLRKSAKAKRVTTPRDFSSLLNSKPLGIQQDWH